MQNKIGQSAVEFLIIVVCIIIFLFTFLIIVNQNLTDKYYQEYSLAIKEVGFSVQDEINLATLSLDGYHRTFSVPQTILISDYNISINENVITLITIDGQHAINLPVADINGQIQKGENTIVKENGVIYL